MNMDVKNNPTLTALHKTAKVSAEIAKGLEAGWQPGFDSGRISDANKALYNTAQVALDANHKVLTIAKNSEIEAGRDANLLDAVQNSVSKMAGYCTNYTPRDRDDTNIIKMAAESVLRTIANALDPTMADRTSIESTSNVNADGTANANYMLQDSTSDATNLGDKKLPTAIVPEDFKNMIGAMHAVIAHCNANTNGGVAFPANVTTLYDSGSAETSKMMTQAKDNQEVAEAVREATTKAIGENKDTIKDITNPNLEEIASELSEMQRKSQMLQGIMAMMARVLSDAISAAISAAAA